MQKIRVTPRNIQFQESVEIREIPRKDSDSLIELKQQQPKRSSWDPNLSETEVFQTKPTKQKYVVIGITIGGIVLIAAIIGAVVGVVVSQKATSTADNSLTYNEACKTGSSQCISSQGLYCPNGFCTCSTPYSWNTGSKTCTLLTYNQACTSTSQCDTSLDLMCTGSCTCNNGKVWNISNCVCPGGTFLNSSNICQTAYSLNHSCTIGSNQCDSTKDLFCNNSICQCDFSNKYWNINFQSCKQRLNYTEQCVSDSDCIPTLICPTVPGVCTCPTYLPDYVCNCADTKYYDSTLSQCVNRGTFGGSCTTSANYTCLASLYCNTGTCACPTGTTWISANSSCVITG